jgi:hypothetical protein
MGERRWMGALRMICAALGGIGVGYWTNGGPRWVLSLGLFFTVTLIAIWVDEAGRS